MNNQIEAQTSRFIIVLCLFLFFVGCAPTSEVEPPFSEALPAARRAETARLTGLTTHYQDQYNQANASRAVAAAVARWNGLGTFYADKSSSAETLRWNALAEFHRPTISEAEALRWLALARHYKATRRMPNIK